MKLNERFGKLEKNYLFATIAEKQREYKAAHPKADVISLGIGDVTLPLSAAVTRAMEEASRELSVEKTFRGYPSYEGYPFLRDKIAEYYACRGIAVKPEEIFVSDGAKSDLSNLSDLFSEDNEVLIPEPVYPVYVDTNVLAGRKVRLLAGTEANGFLPMPPEGTADIVYLCSPNNPTGAVYSRAQLDEWVRWATDCGALIIFDAAYEAFIKDPTLPHSIYEIEGAERCAIEVCSFSKTAGFTGVRCGWSVLPEALVADGIRLKDLWFRRQSTKFNGVSYVVQRGAEAVFSEEGQAEIRRAIAYYGENAAIVGEALRSLGISYFGGTDSPYLWLKCPNGYDSWQFFDKLLGDAQVVGTPGSGFGKSGEGYFRLTAFGNRERVKEACARLVGLKF